MRRSYRERAKELEGRAELESGKQYGSSPQKVSKFYESAADTWIKQARNLDEESPRGAKQSLLFAGTNYGLAKKYAGTHVERVRIKKKEGAVEKKLESMIKPSWLSQGRSFAYLAILSFLGALIFISLNLTGHVVENSTSQNFTFAGMGFFMIGLVFVFLYFKSKK